jgi:hypothetical protein
MGDLSNAIGNGIGTLVGRSLDIIGGIVNGVVQTFNGILPGSAVLAVVGIALAIAVVWAIRRP